MTEEQYKISLDNLHKKHKEEIYFLRKSFALANNPHKIGDVIVDHHNTIKIEKIQLAPDSFSNLPSCLYTGIELNKKGEPTKRQSNTTIWQSNLRLAPDKNKA